MNTWPLVVHLTLPQSLRRSGPTAWGLRNRGDATLHSWLEGPALDPAGELWFVDVAYGRILRTTRDGEIEVALEYDGAPNGLAFDDDTLVVADGRRGLLRVDVTARPAVISHEVGTWDGEPFLGLNDLAIHPDGTVLMTDQGMTGLHDPSGRVLALSPLGNTILLSGIPSPNGIAVRDGGNEVLVAVTRDNAVWRAPLDEDSKPYRVGRFIQMSGGTGPDGICLGADGELFVAHLGMGIVWRYDRVGRLTGGYEVPDGMNPTNVAFSPPEGVIYVTEADTGTVLVGEV